MTYIFFQTIGADEGVFRRRNMAEISAAAKCHLWVKCCAGKLCVSQKVIPNHFGAPPWRYKRWIEYVQIIIAPIGMSVAKGYILRNTSPTGLQVAL